jgi:hypothetical protein
MSSLLDLTYTIKDCVLKVTIEHQDPRITSGRPLNEDVREFQKRMKVRFPLDYSKEFMVLVEGTPDHAEISSANYVEIVPLSYFTSKQETGPILFIKGSTGKANYYSFRFETKEQLLEYVRRMINSIEVLNRRLDPDYCYPELVLPD